MQFFRPVVPVSVVFTEDHSGRPSGEADVEFKNHEDAVRAMSKVGVALLGVFLNDLLT